MEILNSKNTKLKERRTEEEEKGKTRSSNTQTQ